MLKSKIATMLIAGVVLGGGAVAYAQTQPADPSTDAAGRGPRPDRAEARACVKAHRENPDVEPSAECGALRERFKAGRKGEGEHPLLRRGIHGEILVKEGEGFSTLVFDRGEVTSASDGSITLKRPDGESVTVGTDDATEYKGIDGFDQLRTGDPALVVTKAGRTVLVAQRPLDGEGDRQAPPGVARFDGNSEDSLIVL